MDTKLSRDPNPVVGLYDRFGRRHQYLRFSLTEACNIACSYCLPDGFPEWFRHKSTLKKPQINAVLRAFKGLGFSKVRFTGGEPSLHPDLAFAVTQARDLGFKQISITTNGLLLRDIQTWKQRGLTSLNISLDTLDQHRFEKLTKSKNHKTVLELIEASIDAGLQTKINTVLLRSVNADEIDALIQWGLNRDLCLRFIELMPTELNQSFDQRERVSGEEIRHKLKALGLDRVVATKPEGTEGPAEIYSSANYLGSIGLINPLSCNFCSACNRLRVTAKGKLRLCLFGGTDIDLDLENEGTMVRQIFDAISQKTKGHGLEDRDWGNVSTFRTIGG